VAEEVVEEDCAVLIDVVEDDSIVDVEGRLPPEELCDEQAEFEAVTEI
jgi:hypothetical protein